MLGAIWANSFTISMRKISIKEEYIPITTTAQRARLVWLPPILLMLLIFTLSSESSFGEPDYFATRLARGTLPGWFSYFNPLIPWLDRNIGILAHATLYMLLALLVARAAAYTPRLMPHALRWAWFIAVGFGALDEVHQAFVPGRTPTLWDILVNSLGATAGIVLWQVLHHRWQKRRTR